jgi:uncharacterized lipoprotein YbaY
MKNITKLSLMASAAVLLAACASPPPSAPDRTASATLEGRSGSAVTGVVTFSSRGDKLYAGRARFPRA